jgi:copper(I)-binding protein
VAGRLDGLPPGLSTIAGKIEAMHVKLRWLVAGTLVLLAGPAVATDAVLGNLTIEHPYARPTPPGARTGGAYFTIANRGSAADRLLRVASPAAASVELHSMTMDGNLMKMRPVAGVDVPARGKVVLASGGFHVMLVDLRKPLVVGDSVPLTLHFDKAGSVDVVASVEAAGTTGAPKHGH